MSNQTDFEIHYQFRGESRHFSHRALLLCESDALHFATLHAGVWRLKGSLSTGPIRLAILQAEDVGVTQVRWKKTDAQPKV